VKKKFKKEKPMFISAVTGEGIDKLLYRIKEEVVKMREIEAEKSPKKTTEERKVFRPHLELPNIRDYKVWKISDNEYAVSGKRIEQVAIMTDMRKTQSHMRMFDILKKIGAYQKIKKLGAQAGDKILISTRTFEFMDLD
jgi:Obg family GTPase CgtA-like protein